MQAYTIALLVFCMGLALGFVNDMGVFDAGVYAEQPSVTFISADEVSQGIEAEKSGFGFMDFVWGFATALRIFIGALAFSVLPVVALVNSFHVPILLAGVINLCMWFVYGIGVVSFLRGYSVEKS
jgi:hypothetical protein